MPLDPGADCCRIARGHQARRIRGIIFPTISVDQACGVEAQNGPRGHTYTVARNFAQNERASRIAGPINYHPLAGVPQGLKELQERHNVAAWACEDPHVGECRRQRGEKEESRNDGAPHQKSPNGSPTTWSVRTGSHRGGTLRPPDYQSIENISAISMSAISMRASATSRNCAWP
jgi:hypothetical protein